MKHALRLLPLLLLAALAVPRAQAQESAAFEITEISYHIQGRTRQWVLEKLLRDNKVFVGRKLRSRAELDALIADQTQRLVNERTLERAGIEVGVQPRVGLPAAVTLDVRTKDSWNLIGLPYFRYDSNSGLLLALRGRDYNFAGTMQTLVLNLDYRFTEDQTNEWGAKTSLTLPFQWLRHDWSWDISGGFTYDIGEDPIDFSETVNFGLDLETALGIEFRLWPDVWTLAYTQGFHILRDDEDDYDDEYYNESKLSFGTSAGTGWVLPVVEEVKYAPSFFVTVRYKAQGELSENYRGVQPGFSHALAAKRVDWIGNFRDGASASLSNSFAYSLSTDRWLPSFNAELAGYKAASPWGFSGRLSGFYTPRSVNDDDAASAIRGVLDDDMVGNVGLFLNSDLTLKVFTIPRFAEALGSFFFDVAFVRDTYTHSSEGWDLRYTVGAEGVGFPLFARAFYVRISLGWEIAQVIAMFAERDLKMPEIFVGLGHHY